MNSVFTETNELLINLVDNSNSSDVANSEGETQQRQILKAKHNSGKLETESDIDHEESDLANATTSRARPTPKAKVIVTPHIKWKEVSSQNQGLSPVAKGMGDLASVLKKRTRLLIVVDRKRD